jgi:hypothetical protein
METEDFGPTSPRLAIDVYPRRLSRAQNNGEFKAANRRGNQTENTPTFAVWSESSKPIRPRAPRTAAMGNGGG